MASRVRVIGKVAEGTSLGTWEKIKQKEERIATGKKRLNSTQRQARTYRIVFIVISIIILLTLVLSLLHI
jgi:predicted nucleic acid-binding Zn ribbon protein